MEGIQLIKNMPFSEAVQMAGLVEYQDGQVISRTITQRDDLSITLFAFDKGEAISSHSSPGDALAYVMDGTAEITIGEKKISAKKGETVVMPANIPHGLEATEAFKMLLIVVKPQF
ncbi:cupin domain-containing protein [Alkaliphilus peptidifermentans]|uniref:Cupin domain protein n=1 Tax=Alkaliphilus peptidifermentans DSM 18978 TaxID=1120976 RepID=A0A1G5C0Z0_9FIRM|nr:cupin domain-containing protein [Alkaliphilus peptidifermentans]SCX95960.1 Cupin domain protein [Alkaliphilus peptidifermentans DSM 18978]